MLKCSYCAKKFKYESEKKRHELSHIPQFECKECCKKFSFVSALKRHQKQHERTCSVICSDCGRSFKDETLLKRHIKYAHKGIHVCSKCSSTFNSDLALSSHMKSHRPKSERRFKCKYSDCTKSFNFSHHLKHHELTHTNQKQYNCKICGKGFIQLHHLKTHLKSHLLANLSMDSTDQDCSNENEHTALNKSTIDSGISSDSNGDIISQESIKGLKHCVICGQMIKSSLYEYHKEKCVLNKEIPEDLSLKLLPSTEFYNNNTKLGTVKPELNCESVLGGCIVSGDSPGGSNCLCAQIKIDVDFHDIASPIEPVNARNDLISIESLGDRGFTNNTCGGCDCTNKKTCNLKEANRNKRDYDNKTEYPEIECRSDGVIKIKDTFDFEIAEICTPINEFEQNDSFQFNNVVPYNSCQAVLGRCIVSGNGTISEECLCAKMAMDDQTNIAQEIDEITPQPNISITTKT